MRQTKQKALNQMPSFPPVHKNCHSLYPEEISMVCTSHEGDRGSQPQTIQDVSNLVQNLSVPRVTNFTCLCSPKGVVPVPGSGPGQAGAVGQWKEGVPAMAGVGWDGI